MVVVLAIFVTVVVVVSVAPLKFPQQPGGEELW